MNGKTFCFIVIFFVASLQTWKKQPWFALDQSTARILVILTRTHGPRVNSTKCPFPIRAPRPFPVAPPAPFPVSHLSPGPVQPLQCGLDQSPQTRSDLINTLVLLRPLTGLPPVLLLTGPRERNRNYKTPGRCLTLLHSRGRASERASSKLVRVRRLSFHAVGVWLFGTSFGRRSALGLTAGEAAWELHGGRAGRFCLRVFLNECEVGASVGWGYSLKFRLVFGGVSS